MNLNPLKWFRKKRVWPTPSQDLIRKRSRLLVIDDGDFPYQELFVRDGYSIEKWDDVKDLSRLERNEFDIILLDIQGVGRKESNEQGFGILKHLRKATPAQIVIAFSNADWSLKYQDFFELADAKLHKGADYVDFKRVVDDQLRRRYSLEYYVEAIVRSAGSNVVDQARLRQLAQEAILVGDTRPLARFIGGVPDSSESLKTALEIAKVGINVLGLIVAAVSA